MVAGERFLRLSEHCSECPDRRSLLVSLLVDWTLPPEPDLRVAWLATFSLGTWSAHAASLVVYEEQATLPRFRRR